MGLQRVGHDWATDLNWTEPKVRLGLTWPSTDQICWAICFCEQERRVFVHLHIIYAVLMLLTSQLTEGRDSVAQRTKSCSIGLGKDWEGRVEAGCFSCGFCFGVFSSKSLPSVVSSDLSFPECEETHSLMCWDTAPPALNLDWYGSRNELRGSNSPTGLVLNVSKSLQEP